MCPRIVFGKHYSLRLWHCGCLGVVQLLLEAESDKNAADANGATALMLAAFNGALEVVRLLLEAGEREQLYC